MNPSVILENWALILFSLWTMGWTGFALWHAALRKEKWWFIFFLLIHTAGVMEIIYLMFVVKLFKITYIRRIEWNKKLRRGKK